MKHFENENLQTQKKVKVKKIIFIFFILLIITIIILLILSYLKNENTRNWVDKVIFRKQISQSNTRIIEIEEDENNKIYAYDKYICIFNKKKLLIYNRVGTKVEEIEVNINKPGFKSAGKYMTIYEEGGNKFYLLCGKDKLFEGEVEGNINLMNINKSGNVSMVLSNSSYKSIIDVFNRNGEELLKTNLVSSKVFDTSISQDNKYLAIAEIDTSGVLIKSSVQIVSIELAQNNPSEAIIEKYEAPSGKLLMNIEYQNNENLVCMYNDNIEIYKNKESKEIVRFEDTKVSFVSIDFNNSISWLEEISTGEYNSDTKVNFINTSTLKKDEYNAKEVAKSIKVFGNKIAVNFGTRLNIINSNGLLVREYISEKEINDIIGTEYLVGIIFRDKIEIINL